MAQWPFRNQQTPQPWDVILKTYIDENPELINKLANPADPVTQAIITRVDTQIDARDFATQTDLAEISDEIDFKIDAADTGYRGQWSATGQDELIWSQDFSTDDNGFIKNHNDIIQGRVDSSTVPGIFGTPPSAGKVLEVKITGSSPSALAGSTFSTATIPAVAGRTITRVEFWTASGKIAGASGQTQAAVVLGTTDLRAGATAVGAAPLPALTWAKTVAEVNGGTFKFQVYSNNVGATAAIYVSDVRIYVASQGAVAYQQGNTVTHNGHLYISLANNNFNQPGDNSGTWKRVVEGISSTATVYGRSLLDAANAAAVRTLIGAGTSSLVIGTTSTTAKAGNYAPAVADISNATTIGRNILLAADAAAVRTLIGASTLAIGTTSTTAKAGDYQPTVAQVSDASPLGRTLMTASDAAAARTAIGAAAQGSATTFPAVLGTKVAFIGDSYMAGLGLTSPTTQRWPRLFCNAAGVTENNVSVSSSGWMNEGVGGNSRFSKQAALIATDCTHVIICGGINDAPIYGTEAALTTAVQGVITAVRTRIPNVPITVVSPMWWAADPSTDLMVVEKVIRAALPADVNFIEQAMWLRFRRTELEQGDGHPNLAGSQLIAAFVRDGMFGKIQPGARMATFVRPGTADASFSGSGTFLASGTILNAAPGWWELDGTAVLYTAQSGHIFVSIGTASWILRSDVTATPQPHKHMVRFFHGGGDLAISVGYSTGGGSTSVIASGNTRVNARLVDDWR